MSLIFLQRISFTYSVYTDRTCVKFCAKNILYLLMSDYYVKAVLTLFLPMFFTLQWIGNKTICVL